jgi:hypothetical protein
MPRGPRSFSSLLFGAPESKQTLVLIFLPLFSSVKGLWIVVLPLQPRVVVASCFFTLAGAVSSISPLSSDLYGIGFGPDLLLLLHHFVRPRGRRGGGGGGGGRENNRRREEKESK